MSDQTPKLYAHKPKKAQIKQFQEKLKKAKELNTPIQSSAAAASYSAGPPPPPPPTPPPPQPPKESFVKRLKFLVPLFVTVNLAIGAYLFMRTKKDTATEEEEVPGVPSTPSSAPTTPTAPVIEKIVNQSIAEPVKVREPVPEDQQHELFKWMLEEKRKIKPKDSEEKKRIDDEKAVLKQFIRAKSIPKI